MRWHVARTCRAYSKQNRRFRRDLWRWEHQEAASWRTPGFSQSDDHPVVCVSWEDASAYARWLGQETGLGYRLPSEAEWEYAARAGTTTHFYWGDGTNHCSYGNAADRTASRTLRPQSSRWAFSDCADGIVWTSSVGAFAPNAFGLYDMSGNVSEWVEDCDHPGYGGAPKDGSAWTVAWTSDGVCSAHMVRGGSWAASPMSLRSALRSRGDAGLRSVTVGFRVARTLD